MTEIVGDDGEINWRPVFATLGEGKSIEIPCSSEADCTKRAVKAAKRAERMGVAVDVIRGPEVLRLEPRLATDPAPGALHPRPDRATLRARRQERVRRREETHGGRDAGEDAEE